MYAFVTFGVFRLFIGIILKLSDFINHVILNDEKKTFECMVITHSSKQKKKETRTRKKEKRGIQ